MRDGGYAREGRGIGPARNRARLETAPSSKPRIVGGIQGRDGSQTSTFGAGGRSDSSGIDTFIEVLPATQREGLTL